MTQQKQMIASDTIEDIIIEESEQSDQNNSVDQSIVNNSEPQGIVQRIRGIGHQTFVHYRQTALWCSSQPGYNQMIPNPTIREEVNTSSAVQTDISSEAESQSESEDSDRTQISSISVSDRKLSLKTKGLININY